MSLTKKDFQTIGTIIDKKLDDKLKPIKSDLTFLKTKVGGLDQKISTVELKISSVDQKMSTVEQKVSSLDTKVISIKQKLDDLSEFTQESIGNILEWTDEIHTTIVKEQLVRRVRRVEKHINLPALAD